MRNIKLTIQYDGTRYKGWQKQDNTDMTIQGKIEAVLNRMTGEDIEVDGSGRTDAGVHAIGQVANFKTESSFSSKEIKDFLYTYLPDDIVVTSVEQVEERFHSRYNAVSKKYLYKIWNDKYHNPFWRRYAVHIQESLNINEMKKAAGYLVGEHDFSSFTTLKSKKKPKIRNIYSIEITKNDKQIEIVVHGNGFLYNMVRIIVGTLIEVGIGNIKADKVNEILNNQDRNYAGPTAVAKGLYLLNVEYNSKFE